MNLGLWGSLVLCVGCSSSATEEGAPVAAARAFARACRSSDVETLLPLLERKVVAQLESRAEQASDHVGGRRKIEAHEMLRVVEIDRMGAIIKAELIESDSERAEVRLTQADGKLHSLILVFEAGAWRVKIDGP